MSGLDLERLVLSGGPLGSVSSGDCSSGTEKLKRSGSCRPHWTSPSSTRMIASSSAKRLPHSSLCRANLPVSSCPSCTLEGETDSEAKLKVSDMYTKLSASRAYVYAVARACDAGNVSRQVSFCIQVSAYQEKLINQDCAGAILYSSDRAVEVAMEAQQCLVSLHALWVGVQLTRTGWERLH